MACCTKQQDLDIVAAGTNVATATPINDYAWQVTVKTSPLLSGIALPNQLLAPGRRIFIVNRGLNLLTIYSTDSAGVRGTSNINGGGSITLTPGAFLTLEYVDNFNWYGPA